MTIATIRQIITDSGGTPTQYGDIPLLRELITSKGGTPTQFEAVGLLRDLIVKQGGTPTQWTMVDLLRELLTAAGGTPVSYDADTLWEAIRVRGLGVAGGLALSAPTLTRTSAATTYPPTIDFTRPIDWADGDYAVMQRSQDATFATGVSEAINQIYAATLTYNFGLSSVVSGSWFFRMMAYRGARAVSPLWSNIVNVGDVVAPTVTSSASPTYAERAVLAHALTASEGVNWSITGGADASLLEISGSTLRLAANALLDYETKTSYAVQVTATDYAGNATAQSMAIAISNVVENPTAFVFTDITGATVSTAYTSNTITIAGLPAGYAAPLIFSGSGGYIKNGGSVATAATTVVNGDTIAVRLTSSASGAAGLSGTVSIGGETVPYSDTYTVTTVGFTPADLWLATETGDWWDANDIATMWQDAAGTTAAVVGNQVKRWVGKKNGIVLTVKATNGPTLRQTGGGHYYLEAASGQSMGLTNSTLYNWGNATDGTWSAGLAVSVPDVTGTRPYLTVDNGGANRVGYLRQLVAASNAVGFASTTNASDSSGQTISANTPFTHIGRRTTTTAESIHNNSSDGTTASTGTLTKTGPIDLFYGSSTYQVCNIYGAVVWIARTITTGETTSLHTYLSGLTS